jgi:hypothetical protein
MGKSHGRMARGGHELPKVSQGLVMPDPSMPCGRATAETALWPFQGWPARRVGGLRPSTILLDTPLCTPMGDGQEGDIPQHVSQERDFAIGVTTDYQLLAEYPALPGKE